MGERKVLNKYYPPDFDTIRLPKLPGGRPDQYVIRIMAPFTMRCLTCGNYVYKGRKFNSRKEDAKGDKYLGIQIYRFYIRCPECLSEITFKTDPQNADYVAEHGAVRTFQAERLAELEEQREVEEKEEEAANNPMLALENRTAESRMEMDVLDALEEIRDWNARNASVKHEQLLEGLMNAEQTEEEVEEEVLTGAAQRAFQKKRDSVKRLEEEAEAPPTKQPRVAMEKPQHTKKQKMSELVVRKNSNLKSGRGNDQSVSQSKVKGSIIDNNKTEVAEGSKVQQGAEGSRVQQGAEGSKVRQGAEGSKVQGGLGLLCDYSESSSSDND